MIKKFMDCRVKIDTVCWVELSNFATLCEYGNKTMDYLIVHVLCAQRNLSEVRE